MGSIHIFKRLSNFHNSAVQLSKWYWKVLLVYLYWRESISIVINNKYRTLAGWQGCCGTHILTANYLPHSLHKYIFIYFGYWHYLFNIMLASPTGMSIKLIVTLRKSNPATSRFFSVFVNSINIITVSSEC